MLLAKKIFFLVSLCLCCLNAYGASYNIASYSATLSRPSKGGGVGAWALSGGSLPFLFNNPYPITGFACPVYCNPLPCPKYRIAVTNKKEKFNKAKTEKALKLKKQTNIILYEIEITPNFDVKNPSLIKKSYNPKTDKAGEYTSDLIFTQVWSL